MKEFKALFLSVLILLTVYFGELSAKQVWDCLFLFH